MGQILRARTAFAVGHKIVAAGALVDSDDPLVKGREGLFAPVVEQATAAPGERRAVKRPARKAPSSD